MYTYMNKNELSEMYRKNRKALIIPRVQTKDLDEFINSTAVCFNSYGINPSIFNIPKVIKSNKNNVYTLAFIVRDRIKINDNDFNKLLSGAATIIPNIISLNQYITSNMVVE